MTPLPGRRPIHTAYVGAHLFRARLAAEWGELALKTLADCAPDAAGLTAALDYQMDERMFARLKEKLRREPIEDLRIDFEDGFGNRSDQEEDAAAQSAGAEVASGLAREAVPAFLGIRIKALGAERATRASRTLDLFVRSLVERSGGKLPAHFTVTLPKVANAEEVAALVRLLEELESRLRLEAGALTLELMVETPRALLGPDGRCPLPALVAAARGRCVGVHFGVYDYSAALEIAPSHHGLRHPACDHARRVMQVALAGTGVRPLGRVDQHAARRATRPLAPRVATALPGCAALARERLLPRMGPAPRATGDAILQGVSGIHGRGRARGPGGPRGARQPGPTGARLWGDQ